MASWEHIRSEVRSFRASVQPTVTTIRDFTFDSVRDRIYFLANDLSKSSKSPMLFRVDLPPSYSDADLDLEPSQEPGFGHASDQHYHGDQDSDRYEDQEDDDMGLVPFNPDTFQFVTGPSPIPTAPGTRESHSEALPSATDQILAAAPILNWIPVLTEDWLKHSNIALGHSLGDRLSSYQFESSANVLMFPYGSALYTAKVHEDGTIDPQPAQEDREDQETGAGRAYSNLVQNALSASLNFVSVSGPLTSPKIPLSTSRSNLEKGAGSTGARADPKLGGSNLDLIAFTRDRDLWVMTTSGIETQLTFCSRNKKKAAISCGIAEFVMQEEFHRFTNYYWPPPSTTPSVSYTHGKLPQPASLPNSSSPGSIPGASASQSTAVVEKLLYLQVSEAMVDLVVIPRQGMQPDHEEYRYPHAGTPNAVSDLQIVEFVAKQFDEEVVIEPLHKRLWGKVSLYKMLPWLEYIVRFGWLPDGESVWVQLLDRRQQTTAIVIIPLDCFMSVSEHDESTEQTEESLASRVRVIFEEQSDYWINVTDIMYIFPKSYLFGRHLQGSTVAPDPDTIQFILPSERTGFRHLYLARHSTRLGLVLVPITSGEYQVVDKPITVDAMRGLVYFTAKRDSVLETHLYVASFAPGADPGNVRRLTELGFSHHAVLDVEKNRFLTMYSSVDQSPACAVMHLRWGGCRRSGLQYTSAGEIAHACSCGCQLPKISSHAYVIREGICNLSAKEIRQSPIVPSTANQGHGRSNSDSFMNPPRLDSPSSSFNSFKSGSMNSISGFLASHLLSSNLLPKAISPDSSMMVAAGARRRSSLKFGPAHASSSGNAPTLNATHHPVAEFFTFMSSDHVKLKGCLYRPSNYTPGQKYPTLVSIYGGPRSQMVTNEYKLPKFLRVFLATRMGFAVVMIDGRGSNDRGVAFEGRLRHCMGQIEIQDQVEGLQFLARPENGGLVDMGRVAISGWSYGGYLSLMAIAQYPHIFKLAIAGAPVTQWELYNSAYTERYMGLVDENKEGYAKSNVLNWVDQFPDSENRLLIAHGLIDENVHVKNTETLSADLIRLNKPHQIQLYPTERHGLRDARVNEHFETLMFFWLKNYL